MPASEPAGYASGHFNRVYEYIVVPACRMAGFWPERADNPNTNNTASDILKNIIDSDIAICDLSANNQDVLYGLAVRQALGLPLVLIKDLKTYAMFNLLELETVVVDESLRIDTVQKEVESLSEALKKTFANKPVANSLLGRLGIGPDKAIEAQQISFTPPVVESNYQGEVPEHKEPHLPVISPLPDYVGDPITELDVERLRVGDSLFHINYGKGEIKAVRKIGRDKMAEVGFESGSKTLVLGTSGILRTVNE